MAYVPKKTLMAYAPRKKRYAPAAAPDVDTIAALVKLARAAEARRRAWSGGPIAVAPIVLARKSSQGRKTGGSRVPAARRKFLQDDSPPAAGPDASADAGEGMGQVV